MEAVIVLLIGIFTYAIVGEICDYLQEKNERDDIDE